MKKKSWVKLLSMLMVVTMMMSVCMVQAFAAVKPETGVAPCTSGTFQGYSVNASFGRTTNATRLNCYAQSGTNMGVYVGAGGLIQIRVDGIPRVVEAYRSSDYYGYDLTIPFSLTHSYTTATVEFAHNVPVVFGYNGQEYILSTTTRWI